MIKDNLTIESLTIGCNYRIDWDNDSDYYHGFGILISKNPKGYPKGTLKFTLEKGETQYFLLEHVTIINPNAGAFHW